MANESLRNEIRDELFEGIWYDASVGEFYQWDDNGSEVIARTPRGDRVESLGYDDFLDLQDDLYPVSEEAVNFPAEILANFINTHMDEGNFDPDLMFAFKYTELRDDI